MSSEVLAWVKCATENLRFSGTRTIFKNFKNIRVRNLV